MAGVRGARSASGLSASGALNSLHAQGGAGLSGSGGQVGHRSSAGGALPVSLGAAEPVGHGEGGDKGARGGNPFSEGPSLP